MNSEVLTRLKGGLVVSCQPVPGGAMDDPEMVRGFALAALDAGAVGLRIESVANLKAVRAATNAPIIGLIKRDLDDSPVRITPFVEDVRALADAGADIIAFDATDRIRPASVAELLAAVRATGKLAMADCSSEADGRSALAAGVDLVGSTMSGYVGGPEPSEPDFELIASLRQMTPRVIAEGRIKTPEHAAEAIRSGAWCVVVGTAITRPEHVTMWFRAAVEAAGAESAPVLGIDIGGSKILAAVVQRGVVKRELQIATEVNLGPPGWVGALAQELVSWKGEFDRIGVAVTGLVRAGEWSPLNTRTLSFSGGFPLEKTVAEQFGVPVMALNDAQAAAWGESRYGAGRGADMVFLTVSTGIGGGVVVGGRLLRGMAGHFGLTRGQSLGREPVENEASGRWIAEAAARSGHALSTPEVFRAAADGKDWASTILDQSALRLAVLCHDIQLSLDPQRIVIGGGVGLAPGYLQRIERQTEALNLPVQPRLVAAQLGQYAGVVGAADLAVRGAGRDS